MSLFMKSSYGPQNVNNGILSSDRWYAITNYVAICNLEEKRQQNVPCMHILRKDRKHEQKDVKQLIKFESFTMSDKVRKKKIWIHFFDN